MRSRRPTRAQPFAISGGMGDRNLHEYEDYRGEDECQAGPFNIAWHPVNELRDVAEPDNDEDSSKSDVAPILEVGIPVGCHEGNEREDVQQDEVARQRPLDVAIGVLCSQVVGPVLPNVAPAAN